MAAVISKKVVIECDIISNQLCIIRQVYCFRQNLQASILVHCLHNGNVLTGMMSVVHSANMHWSHELLMMVMIMMKSVGFVLHSASLTTIHLQVPCKLHECPTVHDHDVPVLINSASLDSSQLDHSTYQVLHISFLSFHHFQYLSLSVLCC